LIERRWLWALTEGIERMLQKFVGWIKALPPKPNKPE
jgi:hypothetical protein